MVHATSHWMQVDAKKFNSPKHMSSSGIGVSSSVPPQFIPEAFSIDREKGNIVFKFSYDFFSETPDDEYAFTLMTELEEVEPEAIELTVWVDDENTGRISRIQIPAGAVDVLRAHSFKTLRESLEGVHEEHPRWGSFSAVSRLIKSYSSLIFKGSSADE